MIRAEVLLFTKLAEKCRGITEGSEDNKARRFNRMNQHKRLSEQSLFPPERREWGNTILSPAATAMEVCWVIQKENFFKAPDKTQALPTETRARQNT